jgi:hypothetical protein
MVFTSALELNPEKASSFDVKLKDLYVISILSLLADGRSLRSHHVNDFSGIHVVRWLQAHMQQDRLAKEFSIHDNFCRVVHS